MTTTLHLHHAFLYISYPFCTTTTLKYLISRCIEKKKKTSNDEIFFSFWTWIWSLRIQFQGGFAYIWQNKWVGIIPIKTKRTQIHFLSVVLVAVASLNLKVPIKKFENDRVARWEVSWTICASYNHAPAIFRLSLKAYSNFTSRTLKRTFLS